MKTLLRLSVLLFLLTANIATISLCAQSYYVATTGLDTNPGTEALPWKTVAKAASALTAGQTAFVRGGTYNERFTFTNSGTEGKYITITAYPNETPIIDGTGLGNVYLVSLGSKNFIKISGLRVQNGYIGIGSNGSNVIIENNYVYNFSNMGIWLTSCKNSIVKGNILDRTVYTSWGECIAITQCEYIDVCNNEVKNGSPTNTAGGEGIDIMGSKHVRVFSNIVHDLPKKLGIYIDAYDGLDYDLQVFNNKVYNCTNGIVISSEKWNDMEKVWVYNNLTYDMLGGEGIKVVDYFNTNYRIKDIIIENNTMSACKGISIDAPNGSDFIIRNNILYNCTSTIAVPAPPTNLIIANNLSNSGSVSGTGAIIADPLFTDPSAKDFSLKIGSPAIDKGASNNVPFDYNFKTRLVGNGIDLGAIEYGATDLVDLPSISKPTFTLAKSTVNQSTDDGTQNTSSGVVSLTSTTLSTNFTSTSDKIITALRFNNVAVPKGATIINARIKVKTSAACNAGNEAIKINAENSSNSQTLNADANSISTKPRTINAAYWLPGNVTTIGSLINTPCLDFIVGELVSNPNWVSGNALTFIFEFMTGAGKTLQFNAYDSGSGAAEISIEYTLDTITYIPTIKIPNNIVKVLPNPTSDFVTFDLQGQSFKNISITNVLGKVILNKSIDENDHTLSMNVKNWGKGIHFVKFQNNFKTSTCKVIVN